MLNVRVAGGHLYGNSCSLGCRWWCLGWRLFVLSFFPLDVLDEIWDLIEPVSEGFLTYSLNKIYRRKFFHVSHMIMSFPPFCFDF